MSVPQVPPTPPHQPRSAIATALLLIAGLLLLAPGVCAVIFIQEYTSSPYRIPSGFITLWIISFMISALGIALIVYAYRR
jgi:hypothetical protein